MSLNNRKNKKTYFSKNILWQAWAIIDKWNEMPDNFNPPYISKEKIYSLVTEIKNYQSMLKQTQEEIKRLYTEKKYEINIYRDQEYSNDIFITKEKKKKQRREYVEQAVELWNYLKIFKNYHKAFTGDWCKEIYNGKPGAKKLKKNKKELINEN